MKMTFDGYSLNNRFVPLLVSRPSPELVSSATAIEGRDGEEFDAARFGKREFTIKLVAKEKSQKALQQAARELMGKLMSKEPRRFTFDDEKAVNGSTETQLYRMAIVDGTIDPQEFYRDGAWTVRFVQHDPYLYGKKRSISVNANTSVAFDVGGNAEALPVVKSSKSGGNYRFGYTVGGKSYSIVFNGVGNGVTVNFARQKVTSSGAGGDGLQVGSRFVPFSGDVSVQPNARSEITWTERWL